MQEIKLGRRQALVEEILAAIGIGLVLGLAFVALHLA